MEGAMNGPIEFLLAKASFAESIVRADLDLKTQGFADGLRGVPGATYRGYRIEGRAALIPIRGALIPSGPVGLAAYGATSYEGLRSELRRASDDPDIDVIVAMIDSPGGRVTGIDPTADAILAARTRKPVIAVVEGMCCSAAYWLAAQCSTIIVSAFSDVGSIGVISMHVDLSGALGRNGIKVTLIHSGAHKADGHPYAALPDEVRAEIQADADRMRNAFAHAVVGGRGNPLLDHATVLATEARSYHGAEAVRMGLADRVGTLDQVLDRLPQIAAGITPYVRPALSRMAMMSDMPPDASLAALPIEVPLIEAAALAPAILVADVAATRESERERIGRIMGHPFAAEGVGKQLAERYAYQSDKTADEVLVTLDAAATIAADALRAAGSSPKGPTSLDEEMAADRQAILGHDGGLSLHHLTATQRGAMTAARLLGKDPYRAVQNAAGAPRSNHSIELLKKLGMVR